MIAPLEDSEST